MQTNEELKTGEKAEQMEIDIDKDNSEDEKDERAEWTPEFDCYLKGLVSMYGAHNWVTISEEMNKHFLGRPKSSKQCRERWCNKLDSAINHSPWTKQEEAMLILSHMRYKNRWCDIVNTLKGRHNNMIKNRFYSIFRKVKNKIKGNDFGYSSKLELLEIYYMISVMEDYAANPLPPDEPKRKRGKDFMYTLIEDVDSAQLAKYKLALSKKYPLKAPLEKLLEEMLAPVHSIQMQSSAISAIPLPMGDYYMVDLPRTPSPPFVCLTPGSSSYSPQKPSFLTLPEPKSFATKQVLSHDEKEFVMQQSFNPNTPPPNTMTQVHKYASTPMRTGPGYYSSNTGGNAINMHQMRGGFGEASKIANVPQLMPLPQLPPMMGFTQVNQGVQGFRTALPSQFDPSHYANQP